MKPKLKKMNKFLIFVTGYNVIAITLSPFGIYFKEKYLNNKEVINHESIHWRQQMELLIIGFYILYVIEWLIRLVIMPSRAYKSISFENEAYSNDEDLKYLEKRTAYSWVKYIFK